MALSAAEAPSFAFVSTVYTEYLPAKKPNEPDEKVTYPATDIPDVVSIPLGVELQAVVTEHLVAIDAYTQALGANPIFERHARTITKGTETIAEVSKHLQQKHTLALTRPNGIHEFRFVSEDSLSPLPEDETIVVGGEEAVMLRRSILDGMENKLTPVIGFAHAAIRNQAITQEALRSATSILAQGEQLQQRLEPFLDADVFVVTYQDGQSHVTPHTFGVYPKP